MQPTTDQDEIEHRAPRGRGLFGTVSLVFAGVILLAGIGCILYEIVRQAGYHVSYRDRTLQLEADTLRITNKWLHEKSNVARLSGQIGRMESFAYRFRDQRDSSFRASDVLQSGMSYAKRQAAYFAALVANRTLDTVYLSRPAAVRDSAVTDAGLKTANRARIATVLNDSLARSIAARDVRLDALRDERARTGRRVAALRSYVADERAKATGIFSGRRRRVLKAVEQKAAELQEPTLESELNN